MKILLSMLFAVSTTALAKPDYVSVQTGGYQGFVTVGAGLEVDWWRTEWSIGHTPMPMTARCVTQINWKNSVQTSLDSKHKVYAGVSLLHVILDKDMFVELPERYPDGYYPPNALRLSPHVGIERKFGKFGIHAELNTLDHYMEIYARSDYKVDLYEVGTYALGVTMDLP